ncbi:hypothetical protein PSFL6913_28525 [Pseudomonas fluorescens]|nr:hypothetical protein ALQ35_200031 [Pseudomonas fluorescens]
MRAAGSGQRLDQEHVYGDIRCGPRLAHKGQGPNGNRLAVHLLAAYARVGNRFDKAITQVGNASLALELELQRLHGELDRHLLDKARGSVPSRWAIALQLAVQQLRVVATDINAADQVLEHLRHVRIADRLPAQINLHLPLGQTREVVQGHVDQAHLLPFDVAAAQVTHGDLEHHFQILRGVAFTCQLLVQLLPGKSADIGDAVEEGAPVVALYAAGQCQ